MKLHWRSDPELSAARAAFVVATGMPCIDHKTEQSLVATVNEINHRLLSASIENGRFWTSYLDRCVAGDVPGIAVAVSLVRSGCNEMQVDQIAKAIISRLNDARQLFFERFPKLDEQLPLRIQPLRQRWDAIGPGLIREIERQVWQNSPPSDWWPPAVTVSAVQPLTGGGGGFDPDADSIWIEAMLTDSDPAIPEVLRVVWLVTSLAIETHIRSRTGQRMISTAWSLVSVPLVLSAASHLEMFPPGNLPIGRAADLWHGVSPKTIRILEQWWQQFAGSSIPLPIALKQLEDSLR